MKTTTLARNGVSTEMVGLISRLVEGASKNSEFAQMLGAEKISPRRICFICKQEIFYATQQLG